MMQVEAGVARLEGDLTLSNASLWLAESEAVLRAGTQIFDMANIGQLDSSALSLMLSLRRRAQAAGSAVEFRNIPENLASLAKLYGVDDQI